MQMIFVGDFYQLPPVSRGPVQVPFAFESAAWRGMCPEVVGQCRLNPG